MPTSTLNPIPLHNPASTPNRIARALRGVGPVGILFFLIVVASTGRYGPLLGGPLVILWALITRSWRALGFIRPKSWPLTIVGSIFAGLLLYLFMKAVVMRMLGFPDSNPRYHYLVHNTAGMLRMLPVMIFSAGFLEELICRGFLFERFGRILGTSRNAKVAIVMVTSVLFAAAHYPEQQWPGVVNALIMSLVVGSYFALRGNLWALIMVHASFDICALLATYFDLTTKVARAIFH